MRGPAALAAASLVLAASAYVVARQPVDAPWWLYADPDASYTASGLNLLLGGDTRFFGHPGMLQQELLAATFGAQELWERATGDASSTREFVDTRLLDLDLTRGVFRGWAIAFFLLGALLTFAVAATTLGGVWWGLLGGLLWVAAPDAAAGSIQIRPDVLLTLLSVAAIFAVARGAELRDARWYAGGAFLIGLAVTVKLHAVGLLPALALAALARPPVEALRAPRRRRLVLGVAAAWLVLAVLLNARHLPFSPSGEQIRLVLGAFAVVGLWLAAAVAVSRRRRLRALDPLYPTLAAFVLGGIALPLTLVLDDGLRMATEMREGLTGGGAAAGVPLFTMDWHLFESFPLRQAIVLFALAAIGAAVALRRREVAPAIWFAAAAVMGVMGAARLGALRYFEPAYALSIVPALSLFATRRAVTAPLAAAVVTAFVVWPSLDNAGVAERQARLDEQHAAAADRVADALLGPNDVALAPDYAPIPDERYWGLVQNFVEYTPPHPYRFLPDYGPALATAGMRRIHYYVGPAAVSLAAEGMLTLGSGTWYARPVPEHFTQFFGVAELLSPPGHPEARYDATDGLYRDEAGNAYDNAGNPSS